MGTLETNTAYELLEDTEIESQITSQIISEGQYIREHEQKRTSHGEHNKRRVKVRVFYVNVDSIDAGDTGKLTFLKEQINLHDDKRTTHVVAVIWTRLKPSLDGGLVKTELALDGYTFLPSDCTSKDSEEEEKLGPNRRLLVAVKIRTPALKVRTFQQLSGNFIVCAIVFDCKFKCRQCVSVEKVEDAIYPFGLLRYKGLAAEGLNGMDEQLTSKVNRFAQNIASPTVMVGDFSLGIDRAEYHWSYHGDCYVLMFHGIPLDTDRGVLDLVFSNSPGLVSNIQNRVISNTDKQDHCILTFDLILGYDCDM